MKHPTLTSRAGILLLTTALLTCMTVPALACPSKKSRDKNTSISSESPVKTYATDSGDHQEDSADETEDMSEAVAQMESETDMNEAVSQTESETDAADVNGYSGFTFETVDINGDPFTIDDIRSSRLVMLNFWEPWCGPCVNEMPDLEKLYENYKDDGFLILGVYSSLPLRDDVTSIIEDIGITYPILQIDESLSGFDTGYVPTTVFLTGDGYFLTDTPITNALPYEKWEEIVNICLEMLP